MVHHTPEPARSTSGRWPRVVDTSLPSPADFCKTGEPRLEGPTTWSERIRAHLLLEPSYCCDMSSAVLAGAAYEVPIALHLVIGAAHHLGSAGQRDGNLPHSCSIVQCVARQEPCRSGGRCIFQGKFDGKSHSAIRISASPNLTAVLRDDSVCDR